VQLKDQSQSGLRVPQDIEAIQVPKVLVSGFNLPAALRLITLVPIKRVLGVPLGNEIVELMAQSHRVE
jgi:hypothetical protein